MNVVILSQMIAFCNNSLIFATCFFQTHIQTSGVCGIAIAQRVGELAANIAKISHIAISFTRLLT